jgi:hypothetical protein
MYFAGNIKYIRPIANNGSMNLLNEGKQIEAEGGFM